MEYSTLAGGSELLWHREAASISQPRCSASDKGLSDTTFHIYRYVVVSKETGSWDLLSAQAWWESLYI